jgi:hypothetical protein
MGIWAGLGKLWWEWTWFKLWFAGMESYEYACMHSYANEGTFASFP